MSDQEGAAAVAALPPCPECGGDLEKISQADGGVIEETVWTQGGLRRKCRPASYWVCTACEYCTERRPR
jgi:hypothetical protein